MTDERYSKIIEAIKKARRFVVVSHVNPEGDAVGSLLGMYLGLKAMGKEAVAYLEDNVPAPYGFLPGSSDIVHTLDGVKDIDCTIAVDCGQADRLGDKFSSFKEKGVFLNIDHHVTNDNYGDVNLVVPEAAAAGEIVYDVLKAAGAGITKDIAINLYTAIHTDTGSFRYDCSTPEAFRKAGELVAAGASPWDISVKVYENYPAERFKLLGTTLLTLEFRDENRIAIVNVTLEAIKSSGGTKDMTDGFVNYARAIEGVEVGALFREVKNGEYKASLRSKGRIDVSGVAGLFNGGGHAHAAGFSIKGTLLEVKAKVVAELEKALIEQSSPSPYPLPVGERRGKM
ncbi:MAG: bifunctional oligoribonuclease/PAP phosphatase NrnA [Thermodesulfobacteriota bacterium]